MALAGSCSAPDEASVRSAAAKRLSNLGISTSGYKLHSSTAKSTNFRSQSSSVVFGTPLSAVPHQNVKCCGQLVQVPTFVYQLCTLLKSNLSIEGIFRKAGSQMRQKEIKRLIDCGGKLDKSHHIIDLASLLKQYLRALPEPVIKNDLQEVLVRCLLLPESDRMCAITLSLLMMSTPHLHLLHYIMEFFKCVSLKSDSNKMDCNNLAIVIAPTIMPPPLSCSSQRMDYHLKLVKILIENSNMIGIVPDNLCLIDDASKENQKKKKRRSGSLTRMFTGLRKMVTNSSNKPINPEVMATPILDKGQNKRKQEELQAFSAKKRKEILDSLPLQTFSTPIRPLAEKEQKKLRLSIGRKTKDKNSQKASKECKKNKYSGVLDKLEKSSQEFDLKSCLTNDVMEIDLSNKECDYVRIPKSEYEAIKNRVSAIENRISQEFNVITGIDETEPVHQVQTAYEKTLEEAAMLTSPSSERIARRRSRELKIRQSGEHKIIRSPSARKIGIIRRRSREITTKLIRTQTWTVSSNSGLQNPSNNKSNQFYTAASLRRGRPNTVNTGLSQPNPNPNSNKYFPNENKRISFDDSFHVRSPSIDNNILTNRDVFSKNRIKRPSSFHGHIDNGNSGTRLNTVRMDIDENQWKDPRLLLSNADSFDNPLTGRASVAKLRSQMAGMVLAKARLFDGLTDSDSSLEKKITAKPCRQVSSFARKSRKCISPDKNAHKANTSDEFSPQMDTKLAKKAPYKSPGLVSKRHRNKVTRSPLVSKKAKDSLNLSSQLKEVIYDVCTPLSEKVNANEHCTPTQKLKNSSKNGVSFKSPRSTPHMKKSLHPKPAAGLKSAQADVEMRRFNTPMRANHNTPRRQSPRLLSMKSRQY